MLFIFHNDFNTSHHFIILREKSEHKPRLDLNVISFYQASDLRLKMAKNCLTKYPENNGIMDAESVGNRLTLHDYTISDTV